MRPSILLLFLALLIERANSSPFRFEFDRPRDGIRAWPRDDEASKQVTRQEVVAFLTHVGDSLPFVKGWDDVYDFRFVRLEPGRLFLVAVVSSGGSLGYQEIVAIFCDELSCTNDPFGGVPPIDLSSRLVSASDNGVYQIIEEMWVESTLPESPTVFTLYEMGPEGGYDASAKYRDWYREHLFPKLQRQLKKTFDPGEVNADRIAQYHAAAQYALDHYRQEVLGVRGALMEHALEWATSPYPEVHTLAESAVMHAYDSPAADKVLNALERSSSPSVREQAIEIRREHAARRAEKDGKPQ